MQGENAVRTIARFIWLAAMLSELRTTSVVTGSASTAPDPPATRKVTSSRVIGSPFGRTGTYSAAARAWNTWG